MDASERPRIAIMYVRIIHTLDYTALISENGSTAAQESLV
jgi:hypothetical protein